MKRSVLAIALGFLVAGASIASRVIADDSAAAKPAALNFTMKDIDGKDVDLSSYKGKVIMMLNVASKCGNTPQYTALEKVYEKYKDKGLVIIGFPANNFGGQEPGTDEQIKEFCTGADSQYHVKFPLMSKVSVKGDDIAPLFKYLTSQDSKPLSKGDIKWNFEKFLIGRDGKLVGRFGNRTQPEDATVIAAIEKALAEK